MTSVNKKILTPKDVIEMHKAGQPVITISEDFATEAKANRDKTTFYINIKSRGTYAKLKVQRQVISAGANAFDKKKNEKVPVTFKKLTREDLETTEYPKEKYDQLLHDNHEFIEALDIIATEFEQIYENTLLKKNGPWGFPVAISKRAFYNFKKVSRKPTDEELRKSRTLKPGEQSVIDPKTGEVPYKTPLYKIKLPVMTDGKIGKTNFQTKAYEPVVFDLRRKIPPEQQKPGGEPVEVAKLKTQTGESKDLTVANVGQFVTAKSNVTATIAIKSITVSPNGISLDIIFDKLYVMPHKIIITKAISNEELNESDDLLTNDEDMVERLDEEKKDAAPAEKPRRPDTNVKEQPIDEPDDEPTDNAPEQTTMPNQEEDAEEGEEQEEEPEPEPVKPPPKAATKPKATTTTNATTTTATATKNGVKTAAKPKNK